MKTLICEEPGNLVYQDRPVPELGSGKTLLKIKRIGICGTDLHAFEGTQPYFSYPRVLGHELAADIEKLGAAEGFEEKEPVTFIPYFHCGKCIACRNGLTNCCASMQVCGVHVDGGMVEYLSVPSESLIHGNGLSYDEMALLEPLAISRHGIRRAGVKEGENVLVVGAGPIGLGLIEFARVAGGKVTVMDISENKLGFCEKNLKVFGTINPLDKDAHEKMLDLTNGEMYPVVIDATGSQKAMLNSFSYLSHGARYVLVGLQKGEISFSHPEFHKREATLMSSRNATREDFEYVMEALKSKSINPNTFITHRTQFSEVANQFESWLDPKNGVIKAMVEV